MDYTVHGWDWSAWNEPIDYVRVKAWCDNNHFRCDFLFDKITEGVTYYNTAHPAQWAGIRTINPDCLRSGYHYMLVSQDGKAQAAFFLSKAPSGEMPPALDCEDGWLTTKSTPAQIALASANLWSYTDTLVQKLGRHIVGYTNNSWWSMLKGHPLALKAAGEMDFWGAEYHYLGGALPVVPQGFDKTYGATMWQFTSQQVVDGIGYSDGEDESVWIGGLDQLKAWAKSPFPVPSVPPIPPTVGLPYNVKLNKTTWVLTVRTQPDPSAPVAHDGLIAQYVLAGQIRTVTREQNGWGFIGAGWINLANTVKVCRV